MINLKIDPEFQNQISLNITYIYRIIQCIPPVQ